MADEQLTIYPTFVIGLGGTGTDVARYTKRRFLRTWNKRLAAARRAVADLTSQGNDLVEELPAALQILAVDTEPLVNEPDDEAIYSHEFAYMGRFDATRLVQHRREHGNIYDWWQWSETELPLGYIHSGAKQARPIGRLAFFRGYPLFNKMMLKKLDDMRLIAETKAAQEENVPLTSGDQRLIFIVSSLSGGTGSGMFLDAAYTVRHYCVERGYKAQIMGIFLLPSVFMNEVKSVPQQHRINANAYAALKELHHFQAGYQPFSALYLGEPDPIPTDGHPPFDRIFLLDRRDSEGQSLSNKSAVEQMAAQFIHLMAFSHLSKRIMAQADNANTEQQGASSDRRGYLSYSSFGVSSLVMPRDALWRFFLSQVTQWVIEQLFWQDVDTAAVTTAHQDFVTSLVNQFNALHGDRWDGLNALTEALGQDSETWETFRNMLVDSGYQLLRRRGLNSLRALLSSLTMQQGDQGYRSGMLADRRPMAVVTEPAPDGWFDSLRLTPQQQRDRRAALDNFRFYQALNRAWDTLIGRIHQAANAFLADIGRLDENIDDIWRQMQQSRRRAAQDLHPLRRNDDNETSTYYDLESGAVGLGQLEDFWERTRGLLTPQAQEELMQNVYLGLLDGGAAADLRGAVESYLGGLRDDVDRAFDIRHIVYLQHSSGTRPANYRPDQLFTPNQPHASVDGDIFPWSTAMLHPTRLYTRPAGSNSGTTSPEEEALFNRVLRNYGDFEGIQVDDNDRIDAVNIVHGLPLPQLSSIPEMRKWYNTPQFPGRTLHLNADYASWADLVAYEPLAQGGVVPPTNGNKASASPMPNNAPPAVASGVNQPPAAVAVNTPPPPAGASGQQPAPAYSPPANVVQAPPVQPAASSPQPQATAAVTTAAPPAPDVAFSPPPPPLRPLDLPPDLAVPPAEEPAPLLADSVQPLLLDPRVAGNNPPDNSDNGS